MHVAGRPFVAGVGGLVRQPLKLFGVLLAAVVLLCAGRVAHPAPDRAVGRDAVELRWAVELRALVGRRPPG
eukprot:11169715-Lingulodinium_polyedra.AAC.1